MKLHIIQPTGYNSDGKPFKTKTRWVIGLTLPYLASLTPKDFEIKITDERLSDIDYSEKFDLVAISVFTHAARRTYEIASEYRKRGTKVVMGGWHVSFNSDEALKFADSVVIGEAENLWSTILSDSVSGKLKKIYRADSFHDLKNLPRPRWDLLDLSKYRMKYIPVQTTRGCPFACNFCEVSQLNGKKFRFRPIDDVVDEIKEILSLGERKIQFVDDNFASDHNYTKELLRRLIPLKLKWTCLWTVKDNKDKELLDLAKKSGCYHINMGMESVNQESLKSMHKYQNKVSDYEEILGILNKGGFFYSLNFIFGWDADTKNIFDDTLQFLVRNKVPLAFFSVLAPRKGTKIYEEFLREGRILQNDQTTFRGERCVFKPKNITPQELENGVWYLYQKFYSLPSILKRVFVKRTGFHEVFLSNLIFNSVAKRRKSPLDFY